MAILNEQSKVAPEVTLCVPDNASGVVRATPNQASLNSDDLTSRRPPSLHSSTINNHQRHLTTAQTNEPLEEIGETGGGLLLHLQ
ncbi:unnamed protein product [Rotaria sordida]|uniref:Uncharacterized protein n=1 Tax=Rotaria sordida TaxID=392033 RepID=A0A815S2M3_9BILA|nr:unnamed protein product [Rotaria sordida]CAF1184694.1 unnamed protein product [Rotaria sordida]CAF1208942.1 unnamed protein product [Rotaria sordida]CAF1247325.1 unnamed protein product [Rotaria sordida]CAF1484886.1 unnamed protein product [Rotaria sordida]